MKAVVCAAYGDPEDLALVTDAAAPNPGPGQVAIDVKVAALNFPDLLTIKGAYQVRPEPPFSPGFEASGLIAAVGDGVTELSVGDRVAAAGVFGAFAERWIVDADHCVVVPDRVSFETAAATIIAYATSYHALVNRAPIARNDTLLVLGAAGGVGSAAVEIGAMLGARVIAAASSDDKLAHCRERGAADTINYATEDLRTRVKELTSGRGVDVVYDPVGGEYAEPAFRSLGWRGRHLVIGFTAGEIPRVPWNLALLKEASVVGVYWGGWSMHDPAGSRRFLEQVFALVEDGSLSPSVTASFPIDEFLKAYDLVRSRAARGKVVLRIGA
ncbi:MAG: NADPH:quinone oxidoreductase family protein [Acidimicrobiia bacterium]